MNRRNGAPISANADKYGPVFPNQGKRILFKQWLALFLQHHFRFREKTAQ